MTGPLMLQQAYMELLDHVGEEVQVGIMLPPGDVPSTACHGTLRHQAPRLPDTLAYRDAKTRRWTQRLLRPGDVDAVFMVGEFVLPLRTEHVVAAHRTRSGDRPGLDFTINAGQSVLTVRVTFPTTSGD